MKNIAKSVACIMLVLTMIFTLSSCKSKNEITEENIVETVATVEKALNEFDTKTLEKYVSSKTLGYILTCADDHEQFVELGKAIFGNLSIEVQEVNVEQKSVTINVKNKKLSAAASSFARKLKSQYSTLQLLSKLNDDDFLDESLKTLVDSINSTTQTTEVTTTLYVEQGKRNLVLSFDDDAENAVSGGALKAIKSLYGSN